MSTAIKENNSEAIGGNKSEGRFAGKTVLVAGMGKSGIAAMEAFASEGASVAVYDSKDIEGSDSELFLRIAELGVTPYFNGDEPAPEGWDYIAKSPGVPPSLPFIKAALDEGASIISDLDIAYALAPEAATFIAITGTNGKTTTTTLVGEIYKSAGAVCSVTGNIGTPAIESVREARYGTIFVVEASSFQLEDVREFRPKVAAILNLTEDHMDRHGTMEAYGAAKARIFAAQSADDFIVYNADDEIVENMVKSAVSRAFAFSRTRELESGAFLKDGMIVLADSDAVVKKYKGVASGDVMPLIAAGELQIPGSHNIENALAAAAIAYCGGIAPKTIAEALRSFKGVEHRMEHVATIDGVRFVNDSKGTNPDASMKAIEASDAGILLIAGGYDKKSDFRPFVRGFGGKVKHLLLMGATAERFRMEAAEEGFTDATICGGMDECVRLGFELAEAGDTVLLSPASASWDMYSCFEERGEHFKKAVKELMI
ncbi:MAG: UDP-N-acetylmuramoyl-L-alanine--D-glutamate ligase [Clostridiales Family XIII bacterium]|jgi:UDP-N-acetylmuramoylalanine--D-glutamate ligase|nr:UDP-N-acetylmuramoyl-L-alanine--D-glutamate ligase [Clostridiales Family XIII bacterium]